MMKLLEVYIKEIAEIENIELYLIVVLLLFIIWFTLNTKKFYHSEKRKIKNLHRFAREGEAEAQHDLAKRYQKGKQVKKDCQRAAFWYQKASFSGDEKAKGYLQTFFDKYKRKNNC